MSASEPATGPLRLRIGAPAHGGHCVARHEGRVVFVRHAVPGELVEVALTDTSHASWWAGDAVAVLEPSADRVEPPCPISGPGGCGGCDLQHVSAAAQRSWKTEVVRDLLARMAGVSWFGEVEAVPHPEPGWRGRMRYRTDAEGRLAMRAHHSHDLVALPTQGCSIAVEACRPALNGWPAGAEVAVASDGASVATLVDGELVSGPELLEHTVAERGYRVGADGFWQVHPGAAGVLVEAVLTGLEPRAGERAFDLYCGVGLFAGALADAGVQVWGVEGHAPAIDLARINVPEARFTAGRVDRVLRRMPKRTDLVVLDPPRTGAGKQVVDAVLERHPRRIAYVACDPAALARDLKRILAAGWRLDSLRAFDLFPMTHHVECVAVLSPV